MPHKPHIPNALVINLDARWERSQCGGFVGTYAVGAMNKHFCGTSSVSAPAALYALGIEQALAEVETRIGLEDRPLVLRFHAKRGAAFARLVTWTDPTSREASEHPALWHRLHGLHQTGKLRLRWAGKLHHASTEQAAGNK